MNVHGLCINDNSLYVLFCCSLFFCRLQWCFRGSGHATKSFTFSKCQWAKANDEFLQAKLCKEANSRAIARHQKFAFAVRCIHTYIRMWKVLVAITFYHAIWSGSVINDYQKPAVESGYLSWSLGVLNLCAYMTWVVVYVIMPWSKCDLHTLPYY